MALFPISDRVKRLHQTLTTFVEEVCVPAEAVYSAQLGPPGQRFTRIPPVMASLKQQARALGLWNLFLCKPYTEGIGLTNLEYAFLAEVTGRSFLAPEATNGAAPDSGNMEVLARYGTDAQKQQYLVPLLDGRIRSAFLMTEPHVASSDATNIETRIEPDGPDHYRITGRKWWSSGAGDPRCAVFLVMGKTDAAAPRHRQQTLLLVDAAAPGITIHRALTVFGYDDAPHGHMEISLDGVRVPRTHVVLGPGRGFEVVQGRLGPGRIHHCMRAVGMAERALDLLLDRATDPARTPFGKTLAEHGSLPAAVGDARVAIDAARLLVLAAAAAIDQHGPKAARLAIAQAKLAVPAMACRVVDRAIQAYGGAGVAQDVPLAALYAGLRTLRLADGPDEVHRLQISQAELRRARRCRDAAPRRATSVAKL
ncbi:hypothetical protein CXG81DRAFT_20661 [Caulochytrium protostelioides]|uniref:Acyl-CoA dehydrogenase NM domain-like protein n=2 Tax=Caulochytrium protostelioides TaxID=1555241 RepID=A0A4V1IU40_9FUNG|nr:hypothetical protein CXG81DRAFT_20661 [Caulochytrium protostelioides]|eukprot:RKO99227.1 hypothetical protein CXG81DRAFT_20661 [Caulochytrium protostelioides]